MNTRLGALDNLRIVLITLVIAHHVGQAYGPTGGSWPLADARSAAWLGPFFSVNAAFFMGLLFWVAGYFTPGTFDRKGPSRFLRERLLRIGAPLAGYWLLVSVPLSYILGPAGASGQGYLAYLLRPWAWDWLTVYMHLWFLGHLLVYAAAYWVWRLATRLRPFTASGAWLGHGPLVGVVLWLTVAATLTRFWFPQDRWVVLLVAMEPAHLPQYATLFALGIAAARIDWWQRVPSGVGRVWLLVGLAAALVMYLGALWPQAVPLGAIVRNGGLDWRTGVFALWEALVCVGLSVGLLTLFRDALHGTSALARELAADAYATYIVHLLLVVGVQLAVAALPLAPTLKFALVLALAWPLCFLVAGTLRRLPGLRRVL